MTKQQIMISFDNGKWLCDFIEVNNEKTQNEVFDDYMKQYEQTQNSMEIVSKLLPSIIHISAMGE